VRRIHEARQRDPQTDLPHSVLCAKWCKGDSWAVLEANLQTKDFRILYVDPFDGHQKVWNVSRTYEAYLELARRL
jgi:endonuclease YncB( thermonuclease family)